jgi:hypothetical protein
VALLGLPIPVAHQTEEWVRPGGFLPFCNERLLGSDRPTWPLTERDGFHDARGAPPERRPTQQCGR